MWDHRNEALHQSADYQAEILDSLIDDQIHIFYGQGPQAVPRDAIAFFNGNIEDLLQKPKHYKEQWVESVKAAIKRKKHHEYGAYISEQCGMRRWLGLEEPPPRSKLKLTQKPHKKSTWISMHQMANNKIKI